MVGLKLRNILCTLPRVCLLSFQRFLTLPRCISVNSVSWAPQELGAILACASSDGKVSVLTFKSMPSMTMLIPVIYSVF